MKVLVACSCTLGWRCDELSGLSCRMQMQSFNQTIETYYLSPLNCMTLFAHRLPHSNLTSESLMVTPSFVLSFLLLRDLRAKCTSVVICVLFFLSPILNIRICPLSLQLPNLYLSDVILIAKIKRFQLIREEILIIIRPNEKFNFPLLFFHWALVAVTRTDVCGTFNNLLLKMHFSGFFPFISSVNLSEFRHFRL